MTLLTLCEVIKIVCRSVGSNFSLKFEFKVTVEKIVKGPKKIMKVDKNYKHVRCVEDNTNAMQLLKELVKYAKEVMKVSKNTYKIMC